MEIWALTDKGRVRSMNQDSFYYNVAGGNSVALVCDGMGGAAAGEIASSLAARSFVEALERPAPGMEELIGDALEEANNAIYSYSIEHPECTGMGTTLVAAVADQEIVYVVNIGDSRCYYMDENGIRQVTEDHSVVAELVRNGVITADEARFHPRRNLITRCLGAQSDAVGDLFRVRMGPNSMLLLCSDGLTGIVGDDEIFEEAMKGEPETICRRLVDIALDRGAPDNVTVALMRADENGR